MNFEYKSNTLPIKYNDVEPTDEGTEYFDVKFTSDFGSIFKNECFACVDVTEDGTIVCSDENGKVLKTEEYKIVPRGWLFNKLV